jgi:hypothetical protein
MSSLASKKPLSFSTKLIAAFCVVGTVPLLVMAALALLSLEKTSSSLSETYAEQSRTTLDLIDRNFFERYGDVQAFAGNPVVQDRAGWYQPGADASPIVRAMNQYVRLYGIYPLTMLVDLEGKVIAVNDRDRDGKAVDTRWLYEKKFSETPWFKAVRAGQFLKNGSVDGTHVGSPEFDSDVARVSGNNRLAVAFSAPVRDASGAVVAIWTNRADFAVVEEIVHARYEALKRIGATTAEIVVLDQQGTVLLQYDPRTRGNDQVFNDPAVVLKRNLVDEGNEIARGSIGGGSGVDEEENAKKGYLEIVGFAKSAGALGYPGQGWSVLTRVKHDEAHAVAVSTQVTLLLVTLSALVVLAVTAKLLSHRLSLPIMRSLESIRNGSDEISGAARQVASSGTQLAEGATTQAASLEETSASLEEVASMTKRNAEAAGEAKTSLRPDPRRGRCRLARDERDEAGDGRHQSLRRQYREDPQVHRRNRLSDEHPRAERRRRSRARRRGRGGFFRRRRGSPRPRPTLRHGGERDGRENRRLHREDRSGGENLF